MNAQNIAEILVSIGSVAIPALVAIFGKYIAKYIKSNKVASTIVTLASQAVISMQKAGVLTYIEGAVKNSKAVASVESDLIALGFTTKEISKLDSTVISAVESEYAKLTADGTLDVYTQKTAEEATTESAEEKAKELEKAKEALAEAQAKVTALESTSTSESTSESATNSTASTN